MNLFHRVEKEVCIVTLIGQLQMTTANLLEEYLTNLLEKLNLKGVVLSFEQVDYIDSTGFYMMIDLSRTLKEKQIKLAICHILEDLQGVFESIGIDKIIPIYSNEIEALASFQAFSKMTSDNESLPIMHRISSSSE